jgi:uncharacterized cysteine cluster protein YcgN (CxxCxxCC family)
MTATAIKHVNSKLKSLPDTLVEEVEKYIDFLAYKYSQENQDIPQWHKEIVDQRVKDNKNPVDAFEMLKSLEE